MQVQVRRGKGGSHSALPLSARPSCNTQTAVLPLSTPSPSPPIRTTSPSIVRADSRQVRSSSVNRCLFVSSPVQTSASPAVPDSLLLDIDSRARLDSARCSAEQVSVGRRTYAKRKCVVPPSSPLSLSRPPPAVLPLRCAEGDWLENLIRSPTPSPPRIPLPRVQHVNLGLTVYSSFLLQQKGQATVSLSPTLQPLPARAVDVVLATAVQDSQPHCQFPRAGIHRAAGPLTLSAPPVIGIPVSSTAPQPPSPSHPSSASSCFLLPDLPVPEDFSLDSPPRLQRVNSCSSPTTSQSSSSFNSAPPTSPFDPLDIEAQDLAFYLYSQSPFSVKAIESTHRALKPSLKEFAYDTAAKKLGFFQPQSPLVTRAPTTIVFHAAHIMTSSPTSLSAMDINKSTDVPTEHILPTTPATALVDVAAAETTAIIDPSAAASVVAENSPMMSGPPSDRRMAANSTGALTAELPASTPPPQPPSSLPPSPQLTPASSTAATPVASSTTSAADVSIISATDSDLPPEPAADGKISAALAADQSPVAQHAPSLPAPPVAASPSNTDVRNTAGIAKPRRATASSVITESVVNEALILQYISDMQAVNLSEWSTQLVKLVSVQPSVEARAPRIHMACPLPNASETQSSSSRVERYIYLVTWDDKFTRLEISDVNDHTRLSFGKLHELVIEEAKSNDLVLRDISGVPDFLHAVVDLSYVLPLVQQWLINQLTPQIGPALHLQGRQDVRFVRKYCIGESPGSKNCIDWKTIEIYTYNGKYYAFVRQYVEDDGSRVMIVSIPDTPIAHLHSSTRHQQVVSSATLQRCAKLAQYWHGRLPVHRATRMQVDSCWPIVESLCSSDAISKRGIVRVDGSELSDEWSQYHSNTTEVLAYLTAGIGTVTETPFPPLQAGDDTA